MKIKLYELSIMDVLALIITVILLPTLVIKKDVGIFIKMGAYNYSPTKKQVTFLAISFVFVTIEYL